jgi:hypothetical protein
VRDWQLSKHFAASIGCDACHVPAKDAAAAITVASTSCDDKRVRRAVSPRNCQLCHEGQALQFANGKHAVAWVAMAAMPTTGDQPRAVIEKGCGACHRIGLDEGKCDACHTRHLFAGAAS